MVSPADLQTKLQEAWQNHSRFKHRALGARRALDGFHYQFAVSLDRFFDAVLRQQEEIIRVAFEGLSDLSETKGSLIHLTQVKTTLRQESLVAALEEALAIDEFLEESFPYLRQKFLFKITARRIRGGVSLEPSLLSAADLQLDPPAAERWEILRTRCLPVELASAPEIRLAVRLWNDVTRPITLIDSCMGRLLDLIPSGAFPERITKDLLSLWEAARRHSKAPIALLSAENLIDTPSSGRTIVHGVRPSFADLCEGRFMEWPSRLEAALSIVHKRWTAGTKGQGATLPVFWITGPSGAGKSVLLLQLARELVADGQIEAVNWIESYAHVLPRALDHAAGTTAPLIVVGDDLYSPDENRNRAIWGDVGELVAAKTFPSRFGIFTCGPTEQLKAFKHECERHRGLEIIEIAVEALDADEQLAYHAWYQERTDSKVPLSKEPILVAAAWTYELYREEQISPEDFAQRFHTRLKKLDLAQAGLAALALNLYGLKAPEALFTGHRAELAQLVSERIWRLAYPTAATATLAGRFFHPQISRVIYDALIPSREIVRRAGDMARGFDAMLEEGEPADAFLGWIGSGKIGKKRARGAMLLDEDMRVQILNALWYHCFFRRGATENVTPRLKRWHKAALKSGIDVRASGVKARIHSWWLAMDREALPWGLLFQMVWDAADPAERLDLLKPGKTWLEAHFEAGSWTWIYYELGKFTPGDEDLRTLGLLWLEDYPGRAGWPGVWRSLAGRNTEQNMLPEEERLGLVRLALAAIPIQPESDADLAVWERTIQLGAPLVDALNAIIRKLATVRSPYKVEKGVKFVLRHVPAGRLIESLSPAIKETMVGRAWPFVWDDLLESHLDEASRLLPLGRDWLVGHEERPEWNYVWQKLVDQSFELDTLLPLGRDWLVGHEERPGWAFVWRKLVERRFELNALLPLGRDWLVGHEERPGWHIVAQAVRTVRRVDGPNTSRFSNTAACDDPALFDMLYAWIARD